MIELKKPIFLLALFFLLVSFMWTLLPAKQASAAYDGGTLIDNAVFLDSASMSHADIQNFLSSLGSGLATRSLPLTCYGSGSREWGLYTSIGAPCGQTVPASQHIYYASQVYGISPRVILATMQKEQSLVTSPNPTNWQINQAMGYGCPTSGSCSDSSNFFYQVDNGTWALRYHYERARGNMDWWTPSSSWVCGVAKSYYSPNLYPNQNVNFYDEDGALYRTLFVSNAATSALYCYTPHTFNNHRNGVPAQDVPVGTLCYGSHPEYGSNGRCYTGSYNFVYWFEQWFGTTRLPNFNWSLVSQSLYTDSSKTTGASNSLMAGSRVYAVIRIKNTGNLTWTKNSTNTVRLGTIRPLERRSTFCDTTWLSCSRPAGMVETTVAPEQTATFEFWLTAPQQGGTFNEYFTPVVEGVQWMRDIGLFYTLHVQLPIYHWQMTNQYVYTNASKTTVRDMANLRAGEKIYVGFTAQNIGNVTWYNNGTNPIRVGTLNPIERSSIFAPGSNWLGASRPGQMVEASVAPGGTGTFEFWLTVPSNSVGTYHERFGLVAEGRGWLNDVGLSYYSRIIQ